MMDFECDTLVLAYGHESEMALCNSVENSDLEVRVIGDALSPRTAEEAVLEGLKVGCEI